MQLKYFLEQQNKVNELYLKKYPQERTELNIKLSIYSEIMEFIQALGMTHKKEESVDRQKEELMDIFMFCLEYGNASYEFEGTVDLEEIYNGKIVGSLKKETIIELLLKQNLEEMDFSIIITTCVIIFNYYGTTFKEFKELFDKKIKENLERFK